jgi:hypothetical protein
MENFLKLFFLKNFLVKFFWVKFFHEIAERSVAISELALTTTATRRYSTVNTSRRYYDVLFICIHTHSIEGIVAWRVISKQILLRP